ncbi:probable disease resistance protein At5g47250 [Amaranthus tricolor]|uniref:probable disease resistance protein At5g47250 n=1 Tax=Amaranthus tricolor TaxID=29722 RepID=UPI0025851F69|nr:probable disease resistance protein At5g47250 [Amaranthus tricolor]XP_057548975.1 probable disease resistance protein At5g47250 [Amaranthus tricolor]XP_057548976.1 probable disease resistance protein At5g47250 [Amaranthus tricolor]XP_057548977.1 probable disease resistance protein At5g47250 [Amaranthus tricolor]
MEPVAIIAGVWGIIAYFSEVFTLSRCKRILEDEIECLSSKMEDIKGEISSNLCLQYKMQQGDDDLQCWNSKGQDLITKAKSCFMDFGSLRSYLLGTKMKWDAIKLISDLRCHFQAGDKVIKDIMSIARGLSHGYHIPVKQVVGQESSETLAKLKLLLEDDEFGRIAIHGMEGIGKTFLMKHMHNYSLDKFEYVFWISSPKDFTIKCVQDAVAYALKCVFDNYDDLTQRANMLSQTLAGLGKFALFIDSVPEADFSLKDIGIPIPAKGKCKLVLTTRFPAVCRMLHSFKTVTVKLLSGEDAYQLFKNEARMGERFVSTLGGMPQELAETGFGVPRKIVDLATFMSGKDDPHEWRDALHQSRSLGMKNKRLLISGPEPETKRQSKRQKKDTVLSHSSIVDCGTTS